MWLCVCVSGGGGGTSTNREVISLQLAQRWLSWGNAPDMNHGGVAIKDVLMRRWVSGRRTAATAEDDLPTCFQIVWFLWLRHRTAHWNEFGLKRPFWSDILDYTVHPSLVENEEAWVETGIYSVTLLHLLYWRSVWSGMSFMYQRIWKQFHSQSNCTEFPTRISVHPSKCAWLFSSRSMN